MWDFPQNWRSAISPCSKSRVPEIADLDKKLAAVVEEAGVVMEQADAIGIALASDAHAEAGINVLQIAVVPGIDGRAGMDQVGQEEVKIHVLGGLQAGELLVRKQAVVLRDEAQRERGRELIIPLGSDDVIIKNSVPEKIVPHAVEDVGIVNLEAVERLIGQPGVD